MLSNNNIYFRSDKFLFTVRYLNDESNFSKAGKHPRPGGVVDILEACGAFDPGSSPGRGVFFSCISYMHAMKHFMYSKKVIAPDR